MDADNAIPFFSLNDADTPREARLGEALAARGAIVLLDHGIDVSRMSAATRAAERVFALPQDVKARYQGPNDGSQRGFLPVRTQLPNGLQSLDRKEAWHARTAAHAATNLFPPEVPELEREWLPLIDDLERISRVVLASIGAHLGRPRGTLEDTIAGGDSLFRANYYPPGDGQAEDVPGRQRFLPHQDFDLVTLLFGSSGPGLEVQDRSGRWQAVSAPAEAVVAIVGDLLDVESEGAIPATPHRVVASPGDAGARYSMVYFVSPRPEVRLRNGETAGAIVDARLALAGYADEASVR